MLRGGRLRSASVLDELDGDERHETCAGIIAGTFRELAGPRSDRLLELADTDLTSLLDQDGDSELRPSILLPPGHPTATEHRCVVCRPSMVPSASSTNAGSSSGSGAGSGRSKQRISRASLFSIVSPSSRPDESAGATASESAA